MISKGCQNLIVIIYRPMRPIGSESVSIQEHIDILEAYSQSYQSCVSPLCIPITGNLLDGANKKADTSGSTRKSRW